MWNPFLCYINSLHCIDGHSSGALAEQQAKTPFFSQIQVHHPLADEIYGALLNQKTCHYILTGHAGDGKSSIALELYKRFKKIPSDKPLASNICRREDFYEDGIAITLIKDLSEWTVEEQSDLFEEMRQTCRRFLLISNTGCLLQLFKSHIAELGCVSETEVESKLLNAMDSDVSNEMFFGEMHFIVSNLALQDNTDLALKIWEKMIDAEGWDDCKTCPYHVVCPVYDNLNLLSRYEKRITARLRLLLKRTQLYGRRLTLRQYSALFAYMLSSGLDAKQLIESLARGTRYKQGSYYFFNRLFGEAGGKEDLSSHQLQGIQLFRNQGFETRLYPAMEHELWMQDSSARLMPGVPELEKSFYPSLFQKGISESGEKGKEEMRNARKQLRRLFFFLYEPDNDNPSKQTTFKEFLCCFLNSPTLLTYEAWQQDEALFHTDEKTWLTQIYQVLLEQYSGLRLPEGNQNNGHILYMTLARRESDIHQSAQIVLGKINFFENFSLVKANEKIYLCYTSHENPNEQLKLHLPLPFLDYIYERKQGDIETAIQPAFVNRLDNFKSRLLEKSSTPFNMRDKLLLIKQTNSSFIQQKQLKFTTNKNLEVINA